MIKQKQKSQLEKEFDDNYLNLNLNMNSEKQSDKIKTDYLSMLKTDMYGFYCASIHCTVGPLNTDESALIRLRFRLWSKSLAAVNIYFQLSFNRI